MSACYPGHCCQIRDFYGEKKDVELNSKPLYQYSLVLEFQLCEFSERTISVHTLVI